MSLTVYTITFDAADPRALAVFWAQALGYTIAYDNGDEVAAEPPGDSGPALLFIRAGTPKPAVKNRIHLDLNPGSQAAEVDRLMSLGARRIDIGQRDVSWAVLADPEGNEFCVLTPR